MGVKGESARVTADACSAVDIGGARECRKRGKGFGDLCTSDEARNKALGSPISSGLAMSRNLAGANPAQVTASHGSGIQPCSRQSGNRLIDA